MILAPGLHVQQACFQLHKSWYGLAKRFFWLYVAMLQMHSKCKCWDLNVECVVYEINVMVYFQPGE